MSRTKDYRSWWGMHNRCYRKTNKDYHRYGGRGITVCDRWHTFALYYEDMGKRLPGMSLDRIDNNKGYSKENCRWISNKEQHLNRGNNLRLTHAGVTKTQVEWARELNTRSSTVAAQIKRYGSLTAYIQHLAKPKRQVFTPEERKNRARESKRKYREKQKENV